MLNSNEVASIMSKEIPKLLQARIDELEAEIVKSNYVLMAVALKVGNQKVKGRIYKQVNTNSSMLKKGVSV
jgi:hypothetical protein